MFYLETKDGEKFFTDVKSDDRAEFEKIIEQKVGSQAATMFNDFIEEAKLTNSDQLESVATRLDAIIFLLNHLIDTDSVTKVTAENILFDIKDIYNSIMDER